MKARVLTVVGALAIGFALVAAVYLHVDQGPNAAGSSASATRSTSTPESSVVSVGIAGAGDDAQYNPQVVRVVIGVNNTVVWSNDGGPTVHTVTSANLTASGVPLFNSGDMGMGAEFSYTFLKPGTYPYICIYHGTMAGEVIVVAPPHV